MVKWKIAFTGVNDEDLEFYKDHLKEYESKFFKERIEEIDLKEIKEAHILCVFVFDKLTGKVLSEFENLRLIITRSAGYDHIDLKFCKDRGIKVAHMPAYSPKSIAMHTISLILNLTRKIKKVQKRTLDLNYSQEPEILATDLDELTAGIVGTGRIGGWTAKLLYHLGCKVIAHDILENEELKSLGVEYKSLEELLKVSDIVSLHVPYTPQTHHLINEKRRSLMKDSAILINTSRGAVVDTDALYRALLNGKLSGVALDVFEDEDILILNKYEKGISSDKSLKILKLNTFDNVIITPHIAYYTKRAVNNIRKCVVECINMFVHTNSLGRFEVSL